MKKKFTELLLVALITFTFCVDGVYAAKSKALSSAPDLTKGEKPNIVFILVDDMGWSDIGCYGSEISKRLILIVLPRAGFVLRSSITPLNV